MNRNDFMKQLESLLQNIPSTEREEALQYYNDYFDDAGAENEKEVIEALGNPARVAENIKRDLSGNSESVRAKASDRALIEYGRNPGGNVQNPAPVAVEQNKKTEMPTWAIVLLVLLLVFASPVILGVGTGAAGTLIGLITAWFGIIFGFGVAAVALFVVMIFLLVLGIMCLFVDPLVGLGFIGCGLVCGSIGILFMMLTVALGGIATPAICKGIAGLFKKKPQAGKQPV